MIQFKMTDVAATADTEARTIHGMIVPYNEVGRIAGVDYRFLPGSVRCARSRTPLLIDHDRGRPVGVLAELTETDTGAVARFRIDDTPEGDLALKQAASGSRGALSVGATVEASDQNGGVLDVTAGHIHEVSLLALGAFDGATVYDVAAELTPDDPPADDSPAPDDTPAEPTPETEETPMPDETAPPVEAAAAPPMILAERSAPPALNAGQLVVLSIRAQHGDRDAARQIEAALTESPAASLSGLLPPTYERTVLGGKETPRPLYDTFRSRPLPGVGLQVNKPVWTTPPVGAWAATIDADATSSAVVIGTQAATVRRWDWAGAIPWVVVQRSDPSVIDEIYAEAVQNFYLGVEAMIGGEVLAAAPGTSTTLGAGIAEFYLASHKTPDVIIVAPDVWGDLADASALNMSSAAGTPSASGELRASFGGIGIVPSATLAPGSAVIATRRAVDARTTEPVRLTANAIGALNVELAVVGEGLFDTDYPAELLLLAAVTPPAALAAARSKK